jgi:hypothetical protein
MLRSQQIINRQRFKTFIAHSLNCQNIILDCDTQSELLVEVAQDLRAEVKRQWNEEIL